MADKAFQDRMKAYNDAFHRDESEKHFESEIEKFLISPEGGWVKADDSGYRNDIYRGMALDVVTLTDFVKASQPMAWRRFERMCNIDPVRQFYKAFDSAVQQVGLIEVLRHGFKHRGVQFSVCYFAPESTLNTLAVENYQKNICQCIRQWHYSETNNNTVDMMLALNGIPIVAIELKNQLTGQSIDDAKRQWMYNRDPKEPCFGQNKRILAYFAVDLYEAAVATVIDRDKTPFSEIANLTSKIADKTLEQLEREGIFVFPELVKDADDITRDQVILQGLNDCFRTGNVMGFLGYGAERLVIESRFGGDDEDYFLQYLLDRVLDFPNIVDLATDANQDNRLFNFLLFLFPYYLKTAMRKGVFKQYIHRRYNDGNVRGAIDIARHIERNTPFTGSVAYSQREFSYDNYLTELVRHTIEFIKRKPYGNDLLVRVKDEVKLIVDATPGYEQYDRPKIIETNKKNAVRHAYFREYLALQRLCLLILQHQKHQIGAGSKQIYGILFDGAWLWEEYIGSLVDNVFYHPMNKAGKGAQRLFGGNIGLIYPDFISRDHETRVVADAKYKPLDNIGNKDYLQVLAYMLRFDAKKGYYLYPEAEGADDLQLWLNKGSTYEANVVPRDDICIIEHGLKIPIDAENYESFVSKMQVSESEFRQVFIG